MIYELKISTRGKTKCFAVIQAKKVLKMIEDDPRVIATNVDKWGNAVAEMKTIKPS